MEPRCRKCPSSLPAKRTDETYSQAIYFDGYLPLSKRPIRMDRLFKSSLKVQYLGNQPSCPENLVSEADGNSTDFRKASDRRREPVHVPSFLVPSVLDCIRTSTEFGKYVRLVPGEADVYCAQHVFERGGCVVTSDSDLLVHDLKSGSVVFFWSLDLLSPDLSVDGDTNETRQKSMTAYTPMSIVQRLSIPLEQGGMKRFGFELSTKSYGSLPHIIENCRKPPKDPKAFAEFSKPYEPLAPEALVEANAFSDGDGKFLDPRISEIVFQSDAYMSRFCSSARVEREPEAEGPLIFLPLLFECPGRASSWDSSMGIRQLAYSLLLSAYPDPSWSCVRELRRSQSLNNKGKRVELLESTEAEEFALSLLESLDFVAGEFDDLNARFFYFTLHQDQTASEAEGKSSNSFVSVQHFLKNKSKPGRVAWTTVHLTAQLQATYYSLRLLSQIIRVVSASDAVAKLPMQTLDRLGHHLDKLPRLTEYPTVSSLKRLMESLKHDKRLRGKRL